MSIAKVDFSAARWTANPCGRIALRFPRGLRLQAGGTLVDDLTEQRLSRLRTDFPGWRIESDGSDGKPCWLAVSHWVRALSFGMEVHEVFLTANTAGALRERI